MICFIISCSLSWNLGQNIRTKRTLFLEDFLDAHISHFKLIIIAEPDDKELEESLAPSDGSCGVHGPASELQP